MFTPLLLCEKHKNNDVCFCGDRTILGGSRMIAKSLCASFPDHGTRAVATHHMPCGLSNADYQIRTIEYGKILVMLLYGKYYWHVYEVYNKIQYFCIIHTISATVILHLNLTQ